jgi:hypothetical protein
MGDAAIPERLILDISIAMGADGRLITRLHSGVGLSDDSRAAKGDLTSCENIHTWKLETKDIT